MGAGTVLLRAIAKRRLQTVKGQEARVLALLSAAYGCSIPPTVLGTIERAAKRWREGQDCLAMIHLALAGLNSPEDGPDAARQLFIADGLMKAGIAPETILQALVHDAANDDLARFDSSELRVPGGSGVESGRWTTTISALPTLTSGAMRFLGRLALGTLETAAENPVTLALGLILIPKSTNLLVQGEVPEIPGLRYPLLWVFAQKSSEDYAKDLFHDEGDGRERIATTTIPRAGRSQ